MSRFLPAMVIGLFAVMSAPAADLADGIWDRAGGLGPIVKLSGGDAVNLGKLRTSTWERAEVRSVANDNSRFQVVLHNVDKGVNRGDPDRVVLVVAGIGMPNQGQSHHADGRIGLWFTIQGEEDARKVAAGLKTEPVLRKHPGHRIVLKLTPDKESYRPGEAVTLHVDICNVGDKPVLFQHGGKQRGWRNNQFRFLAYGGFGEGKAVPDTGNPSHSGGLSTLRPLAPGESVRETIGLDKWFTFTTPDTYRITGLYELELNYMPERSLRTTIWEDLAVGECLIKVVAPNK